MPILILLLSKITQKVALVNMVTSCAVNLGHYKRQGGAESAAEVEMRTRVELVVRLAVSQGTEVQARLVKNFSWHTMLLVLCPLMLLCDTLARFLFWVPGAAEFSAGLQAPRSLKSVLVLPPQKAKTSKIT